MDDLAAAVQREVRDRGVSNALAHYFAQFVRAANETRAVLLRTLTYGQRADADPKLWCDMLFGTDELLPRVFELCQSTVLALKIHRGLPPAALGVFRGTRDLVGGPPGAASAGSWDTQWLCSCGASNSSTACHCKACAQAKPRTRRKCKHCNAVNDRDARFCDQCGKDMLPLG
jgi:hypothetical protein